MQEVEQMIPGRNHSCSGFSFLYRVLPKARTSVLILLVLLLPRLEPCYALGESERYGKPQQEHLSALFRQMGDREPVPTPEALRSFISDSMIVDLTQDDIESFLSAAARDGLTLLHATALFSQWVRQMGLTVYAPGEAVTNASKEGFYLGLMFPVEHLVHFLYVPDRGRGGDFQAYIRVVYDRQYTYPFDKDIFDADVLVRGTEVPYASRGGTGTGYLVTTEVHYGESGFNYSNVKGISGQKRGALGFLQKVFFFVPKTLHGISLRGNDLVIDAFVNQSISDFEIEDKFRVRIVSD